MPRYAVKIQQILQININKIRDGVSKIFNILFTGCLRGTFAKYSVTKHWQLTDCRCIWSVDA